MNVNVNVSISHCLSLTSNFKGVKNLDPLLKKRISELSPKEMWEKILGTAYNKPVCPGCRRVLKITNVHAEYQLPKKSFSPSSNWFTETASPTIEAEMRCPACDTIVKAIVVGLNFEGEDFYFETLTVTSVIKGNLKTRKEGKT